MYSITVNVCDLFDKVKEINDDKIDFVKLTINKPIDDFTPSCINFTAYKAHEPYTGIDYASVETIEETE